MEIKNVKNNANNPFAERVSIRNYDPAVKISRDEMSNIIQDAMTAPSSFNLQPWRFFVFDSEEGKKFIKPYMMFNQEQWETSSAVIAVYGDMQSTSYADKILSADVGYGIIDEEYKAKMLEIMAAYRQSYTKDDLKNSISLDCGFVSMQLMISAKNYGYDTNPIGGFMKKGLTEALKLDTERYIPIILLSIGKAAEKPKQTTRFSVDEVTVWK